MISVSAGWNGGTRYVGSWETSTACVSVCACGDEGSSADVLKRARAERIDRRGRGGEEDG